MTVQLSPALERRLSEAASASQCSADEIAQAAIESYLAFEAEHRAAIERARAEIVAGRMLEGDQVWSDIHALFQR